MHRPRFESGSERGWHLTVACGGPYSTPLRGAPLIPYSLCHTKWDSTYSLIPHTPYATQNGIPLLPLFRTPYATQNVIPFPPLFHTPYAIPNVIPYSHTPYAMNPLFRYSTYNVMPLIP